MLAGWGSCSRVAIRGEAVPVPQRVFVTIDGKLTAREPVYQRTDNSAGQLIKERNENTAALVRANVKLERIEKCQGTSVDDAHTACRGQ
jgi:hypothetical protein